MWPLNPYKVACDLMAGIIENKRIHEKMVNTKFNKNGPMRDNVLDLMLEGSAEKTDADLGAVGAQMKRTNAELLDMILGAGKILDEQRIPDEDRWCVLPGFVTVVAKEHFIKRSHNCINQKQYAKYREEFEFWRQMRKQQKKAITGGVVGRIDNVNIHLSGNIAT